MACRFVRMLSFALHNASAHIAPYGGARLIALESKHALVVRRLGRVELHFAIPYRQFAGVLLSCDAQGLLRMSLMHRDHDLCLTLFETAHEDDLLAQFSEVARKLSLPRFVEPEPGQRHCLDQCCGAVVLGRASDMRRRRQMAIVRRPCFLVRRRIGERRLMKKIQFYVEIIAPD